MLRCRIPAGELTAIPDTNGIGFTAVRVGEGKGVEPGIYFRVELAGITGHEQFAKDSGILIKPNESVAVAAAIVRVFVESGDRTNRKRARLKYLIDKWGVHETDSHSDDARSESRLRRFGRHCLPNLL
jgi:ferredoxin-nitrite reductase